MLHGKENQPLYNVRPVLDRAGSTTFKPFWGTFDEFVKIAKRLEMQLECRLYLVCHKDSFDRAKMKERINHLDMVYAFG